MNLPGLPIADIAIHVEDARAGFCAVGIDILDTMKQAGIKDAEAAVMTGAMEFAVETFTKTALQSGVPSEKARIVLFEQVRILFEKYRGQ